MKLNRTSWCLLIVAGVLISCMALFIWCAWGRKIYKEKLLARQRAEAIAKIADLANDQAWIDAQIELARSGDDNWLRHNFILMENGEWLVYYNRCGNPDLFIAKGSDGKWYYSSWHFCVNLISMAMFGVERAPPGIVFFNIYFFGEEFDGNSDNCAEPTWSFGGNHIQECLSNECFFVATIKDRAWQRGAFYAYGKPYILDDDMLAKLSLLLPEGYSSRSQDLSSPGQIKLTLQNKVTFTMHREHGLSVEFED